VQKGARAPPKGASPGDRGRRKGKSALGPHCSWEDVSWRVGHEIECRGSTYILEVGGEKRSLGRVGYDATFGDGKKKAYLEGLR